MSLAVAWADALPSDQVACEALWMASYLYKKDTPDGEFVKTDLQEVYGMWQTPVGGDWCGVPGLAWHLEFFAEEEYRITVSARVQPTSNAPTRSHAIGVFATCVGADPDGCFGP